MPPYQFGVKYAQQMMAAPQPPTEPLAQLEPPGGQQMPPGAPGQGQMSPELLAFLQPLLAQGAAGQQGPPGLPGAPGAMPPAATPAPSGPVPTSPMLQD